MNKEIRLIGYATSMVSIALMIAGYYTASGFWQSLLIGLSTSFLGLGLAVVVVNYFLASTDKKAAAKPLLKLIAPNVRECHNELFIRYGHKTFGKDQFENLIDLYQKHNGDPAAFSPEQRKSLYDAIEAEKQELLRVYDALSEQFKELTFLLGWSFDSRITTAAIEARLNYATFRTIVWDASEASQLLAVETFFDAEAATSAVFSGLIKHLGLQESDWLG